MHREEIIKLITNYIKQSQQGIEIEHPKFDFKSKWYDLKSIAGISEFLKDTSAIANTVGLDGFIVIGYNDKNQEFTDSPLKESGLKDTSEIPNIISKHIDNQFSIDYYETSIDGSIIGILHFPPSIDKPHVIRNYKVQHGNDFREEQNKIFIRKSSQTRTANKHDLELMYYDRKNIIPEYDIHVSFHKEAFRQEYQRKHEGKLRIHSKVVLNIENAGRRPAAICNIEFSLSEFADPSSHEIYGFSTLSSNKTFTIVVQPGTIQQVITDVYSTDIYSYDEGKDLYKSLKTNMHKLSTKSMKVQLTNGQQLSVPLEITN